MNNLDVMLIKTAQSIFNRNGRDNANELATNLVVKVSATLNQWALDYGISDEFDLIEAIALDVVKGKITL